LRSFYAAIPKGELSPETGNKHKVVYETWLFPWMGNNARWSMRLWLFPEMGILETLDGYSAKEIDHAGTYVMFLKSLLSIAEIQVWVPQEEKWWEHFQLSTACYEPKCIQKFAHLPIYESIIKGLLNLFFPYLISSHMILMFSSVGI
jgi:hypothetical protein